MNSRGSSTDDQYPDRYDGLLPPRASGHEETEAEPEAIQGVDQVAVRKLGGFNFLTVAQWSAMSRDDRLRLIKAGSVVFLNQGREVPLKPALRYIQTTNHRFD